MCPEKLDAGIIRKILDGRNRYKACKKLNKKPIFKKYPNSITPLQYVIAENIRRRHLNTAQLSEIVLELEKVRLSEEIEKREVEHKKALKEFEEKQKKYEEIKKLEISDKIALKKAKITHIKPRLPKEPTKSEIRLITATELKVSPVSVQKTEKIIGRRYN